MKSWKNRILKKGKYIKALRSSAKDINKIVDMIDEGKIPLSPGDDKTQLALELAKQNSKNQLF